MATKCSDAMLELINALKKQIPDEQDAQEMYWNQSSKLHELQSKEDIAGADVVRAILRKVSDDEGAHEQLLKVIIEHLSLECDLSV